VEVSFRALRQRGMHGGLLEEASVAPLVGHLDKAFLAARARLGHSGGTGAPVLYVVAWLLGGCTP
jgi:hypothetical protein